jgi:lipopolysaccharide/colanic/teichoic acid biosynthesis glycosyltransferase
VSSWLRFRVVIDRIVAAVLLVIASPAIAVAGVLIRRHDGGPSMISVPRVGKAGRPIRMWKLRSMRVEAADGTASGTPLTTEGDERVTPIGARLRARHLDELPQLYNVVRGEMSLFGPRPEAPQFVDLNDARWQVVLCVPPGMAGPTQLIVDSWERQLITKDPTGASYVTDVLPVKLAIDAWYVRRATLGVDVGIVGSLVRRLRPRRSPSDLEARVRAEVPEARRART